MAFRNRILSFGVKPADQFLAHPKNARLHPQFQRDVMQDALTTVGFVAPVIEAKSGYLLDGHERIYQALKTNSDVPFVVVDVDEDEEAFVLATFDPITSLAHYDNVLLDDLLREVDTGSEHIQKMLAVLAEDAEIERLLVEQQVGELGAGRHKLGPRDKSVTCVLYMEQLDLFEKAIVATGLAKRGEAVALICRSYLEQKGQFDFSTEIDFAPNAP